MPGLIGEILPDDIVEIGAGSSEKTRLILDAADRGTGARSATCPWTWTGSPSRPPRPGSSGTTRRSRVHAVVGDFERDLAHVPPPTGRRLALFLGSTIGNLDAPARRRLLAGLRALLPDPGDRLLLGVDLVKDVKVLEAAYDDAAGVTRDFNRNILRVINHARGRRLRARGLPPPRVLQRGGVPHRDAPGRRHRADREARAPRAHRPLPARRGHLDRELLQVHARRRRGDAGRAPRSTSRSGTSTPRTTSPWRSRASCDARRTAPRTRSPPRGFSTSTTI